MAQALADIHTPAREQLKAFVSRIERLEDDKLAIAEDLKAVYSEAKALGFDTKTLRKVIALRKQADDERAEQEAMLDVYLKALGMAHAAVDMGGA